MDLTFDSSWVAGVDGCRAGWMVVAHPVDQPHGARSGIITTFAELLQRCANAAKIAVDMPIGLPEQSGPGGRACDVAARALLGARRASVFAVPARAAVAQADYEQACRAAALHSDPPRKISKQVFNLFGKIREIDALITPDLQNRVVECHPELVFWRLNGGQALSLAKKSRPFGKTDGLACRRHLLIARGYQAGLFETSAWRKSDAASDDLIDACANAAAAADSLAGVAIRVPQEPIHDGHGLRMEIWG